MLSDLKAMVEGVAGLSGRVEEALELAEMVRRNALPTASPFAYVIPTGISPRGEGEASAGAFVQSIDENLAVLVMMHSAGDVSGKRMESALDTLVRAIINAVAGKAPAGALGVFRLVRGRLISLNQGRATYQIDFAIADQVRIV
jgi:hypothetical protein